MTMIWFLLHKGMTPDHLGFIPSFLDDKDPRPAREQFNVNYAHGGGWHPFEGFKMRDDGTLKYPGDPLLRPVAQTTLHGEIIRVYQYSWVTIQHKDGTWEACRMD